jgi:hypothetical protein
MSRVISRHVRSHRIGVGSGGERERGTAADNGKAVENPISIENKSKRKTTKMGKGNRKKKRAKAR